MNIITKKVTLLPVPFVGTKIRIKVPSSSDASLEYRIWVVRRADGCDSFTIDWGDGVHEKKTSHLNQGHVYDAPGEFEIRISDEINYLVICTPNGGTGLYPTQYTPSVLSLVTNATKLLELGSFNGCRNMSTFDIRDSSVSTLSENSFINCTSLSGDIFLPRISDLPYTDRQPFDGCTGGITHIHFSAEHEEAIRNSAAFLADPTLGTGIENVCLFDL